MLIVTGEDTCKDAYYFSTHGCNEGFTDCLVGSPRTWGWKKDMMYSERRCKALNVLAREMFSKANGKVCRWKDAKTERCTRLYTARRGCKRQSTRGNKALKAITQMFRVVQTIPTYAPEKLWIKPCGFTCNYLVFVFLDNLCLASCSIEEENV